MGDEGGGNRTPATCLSQDHAISNQSLGQNHLDHLDFLDHLDHLDNLDDLAKITSGNGSISAPGGFTGSGK